jgi:hypothetical protein
MRDAQAGVALGVGRADRSSRGGARGHRDRRRAYAPERLHDVRIALKKLRYAPELRSRLDVPRGRRRDRTESGAGSARRLHDYETLAAWGRRAGLAPHVLATWPQLKSLVHALEDECRQMRALHGAIARD